MFLKDGLAVTSVRQVSIGNVEYAVKLQARKEVPIARVKVFGGSISLLDTLKGLG